MSICPEKELRERMPENEFWAYVLDVVPDWVIVDDDDYTAPDSEFDDLVPCTICGSRGTCGYDSEGRPMIHLEDNKDD